MVLVALLAAVEYLDLSFYVRGERFGLSASESVLFPLLLGFSTGQVILGVSIAIAIERAIRWRSGLTRGLFNVAQYGIAAAAAAGLWSALADGQEAFTPRDAGAAVLAVAAFALLTHLFTVIAISLAEGRSPRDLTELVGSVSLVNFAGNVTLGVLLAASYSAAAWTVFLFPFALAALYFGYRAVVDQSHARERAAFRLAASRALASSPSLDGAMLGFLRELKGMVSVREAHAIVAMPTGVVWSGVSDAGVVADMHQLENGGLRTLFDRIVAERGTVLVNPEASQELTRFAQDLGATTLLAVPLLEGDSVAGVLVALDRTGTDEFDTTEAELLESLGHELVLTLDSYKLFAEVAEERERFRKIFDASKEGICLLDGEGVVRAWNPSLVRITGFLADDIVGKVLTDLLVIKTRDHVALQGLELVSVSPEEEFEFETRDGQSRWISLLCSPTPSAEDKGWVVLVRDVTAEHLVEEAKSDFLSTISHELRTPLTTIKGSMQILRRGPENLKPATMTQMMGVLSRGTDRLERLVLNLLFVSQIETDGLPRVIPEPVDLEAIVRDKVALFLEDHETVNLEIEEGLPVWGDRERVTQVVEHLIENAQKFSNFTPITVKVSSSAEGVHLMVKDEGPGIPKVDQQRVFERFVRLGHVLTRDTQGPGVGLFIVQKSVEAMGGKVWVESTPDHGAAFHVVFPAAEARVAAGAGA